MMRLIPGVILAIVLAACGSSASGHGTVTSATSSPAAAASPTPNPAVSVLYNALAVDQAAWPGGVDNDPAYLGSYAKGICDSIGKIVLVSLSAGQDAYRFAIATYEQKGYTLVQARAVMNAIIYGYCPQWDQLTNTPAQ